MNLKIWVTIQDIVIAEGIMLNRQKFSLVFPKVIIIQGDGFWRQ